MPDGYILKPCDLREITSELMKDGLLRIKSHWFYKKRKRNEVLLFMHEHGIYTLPTLELVTWLQANIEGTAIEIGAGNGAIGRALGIPITDSKQQERLDMMIAYAGVQQPPIKYPDDIEKLEAMEAVAKYNPNTVIGSYITHKWKPGVSDDGNMFGVDAEEMMLRIDKYIMIGNINTHRNNPIFKRKYKSYPAEWLITRAEDQSKNRVFVFNKIKP